MLIPEILSTVLSDIKSFFSATVSDVVSSGAIKTTLEMLVILMNRFCIRGEQLRTVAIRSIAMQCSVMYIARSNFFISYTKPLQCYFFFSSSSKISGSLVVITSTPMSRKAFISSGSFMVHTFTTSPRSCACLTREGSA